MGKLSVFIFLIVATSTWAKPQDEGDLNLKSIFRTPKDFSKANFDHFEILERSSFKDKDDKAPEDAKAIGDERRSKSIANAQVMLRIGGDDIHDCNRVVLRNPPAISNNVLYPEPQPQPQPQLQPQLYGNNLGYPCLPNPYTGYPYPGHQPYSYPGGYYYNPAPVQNYLPSSYQNINNQFIPSESSLQEAMTQIGKDTGIHYIDEPEGPIACTECSKPQTTLEKPITCSNQFQKVDIVDVPCAASSPTTTQHTTVVETTVKENTPAECETTSVVHTSTNRPDTLPAKVAYVEVNLDDVEKTCSNSPREDITGCLHDQSTVSCQEVSYPTISEEKTISSIPEQKIVITEGPSKVYTSCNRERNPSVPYGHRFSKDIDSLFEIVENRPEIQVCKESPSENIVKIQTTPSSNQVETISPIVPTQAEWTVQGLNPNTEKEVVEIIESKPCHETVIQEVTQESPKTVTTIETPCEIVTVEQPQKESSVQTITNGPIKWSTTQSKHQGEITTITPCSETIETPSVTQEVVHVTGSSPREESEATTCDSDWTTEQVYKSPSVHSINSWPESSSTQEVVQVSNPRFEVIESPYSTNEWNIQKPVVYYSGSSAKSGSQFAIDVAKYGNDYPKVYLEGYKSSYGSGYFSNPLTSVYYKRPTVIDTYRVSKPVLEHTKYIEPQSLVVDTCQVPQSSFPIKEHFKIVHPFSSILESYKIPNPVTPIKQTVVSNWVPHHNKVSEPHIYKIVPKYDIIPRRDIKSLNIPDLVPTNQYLKVNVPNSSHKEVVDRVPIVRNEYHVRGWPYWKNVSVQKEIAATPNSIPLCGPCHKYKGELNELSCKI